MIKTKILDLKLIRKEHPFFFFFGAGLLFLYGLQFALKVEITPLGYFALYSNPSYPQASYQQILPIKGSEDQESKVDFVNIYDSKGMGFLMLEILPSRYQYLRKSDHCNPANHQLLRLGMYDANSTDCDQLQKFDKWFNIYMQRLNVFDSFDTCLIMEASFKDGELIEWTAIK